MQGIIARVNIDDNSAIIVDNDRKQYPFCLDECVGFELYPTVGEKVEFGLENDEVYYVEAIAQSINKESELPQATIGEVVDYISNNKKRAWLEENIPISKSIDECLENYFLDMISAVHKYEAEFEEEEKLDFIAMQRFLNTAYNNLRDIDSSFMDNYLSELRSDLIALEKIYKKFSKKSSIPDIVFESIFLEQQTVYQKNTKRMKINSSELFTLKSSAKSLEEYVKKLEKNLNDSKLSEELKEPKVTEIKRYKRYYVDSIHKMGNLKDENIQLKESLLIFENKYREKFIEVYQNDAKEYDAFIRGQLDGYAYEFDKCMWERAEKSTSIRAFFKKGNIEDDFSSKTFLKYYIKRLDKTKLSTDHKKLIELLEYLESKSKMRALIVSENTLGSDRIKYLLRSFDKNYSVEKIDKARTSYYRPDLKNLDIIFVDSAILNPGIFEFIDMIQKRLEQVKGKAVLCITSSSLKKDELIKLKQKGIRHFLDTNLSDLNLQLVTKKIIDSLEL